MVAIRGKGKETRKKIRDVQPKQNLLGLRLNLVCRLVFPGLVSPIHIRGFASASGSELSALDVGPGWAFVLR